MKRTSIIGTPIILVWISLFWSTTLLAQPNVWFTQTPPDENDIAIKMTIAWRSDEPDAEYRYKVDMPGNWLGGSKSDYQNWSAWGGWTDITYSDFIQEGKYTFVLEARLRGTGSIRRISTEFNVHFVMPEIYEIPTRIDWAKVNAAKDKFRKYRSLAEEYRHAYDIWIRAYDIERRALDLTWSGDQFIHALSGEVLGKGQRMLLDWADNGVSATVSKILSPKALYDIVKQAGLNLVLIYRNAMANKTAFSALGAYWAWKGYEELAREKQGRVVKAYYTSPVVEMKFLLIPAGTFTMGSPPSEVGRYDDEIQHRVKITHAFYAGVREVTQGQWRAVMGTSPSLFDDCGEDCAVDNVSWYEAVEFCNRLSEGEGLTPAYRIKGEEVTWDRKAEGYRLPTEAEWEYVCRAGTTSPFHTGQCLSAEKANYDGSSPLEGCPKERYRKEIVKVGSFAPNAWGLHDMHGNVWEWCWDRYEQYPDKSVINPVGPSFGAYRVIRGGGWIIGPRGCRSARRNWLVPNYRYSALGFRVFRSAK